MWGVAAQWRYTATSRRGGRRRLAGVLRQGLWCAGRGHRGRAGARCCAGSPAALLRQQGYVLALVDTEIHAPDRDVGVEEVVGGDDDDDVCMYVCM